MNAYTNTRHRIKRKAYVRAVVMVVMPVVWPLVTAKGLLLRGAPQPGETSLLFDLTKRVWAEVHREISLLANALIRIHGTINRRPVSGCVRYLTSVNRKLLHLERKFARDPV